MVAYSYPLLQPNTTNDLGCSGKGQLSMSGRKTNVVSSDDRLKDLIKIFHNSSQPKSHLFVSVLKWNDHWSHCEEKTSESISGLHY